MSEIPTSPIPDIKTKSNFGHITSVDDFKILLQQIYKPDPDRDTAVTLALKLMPLVFLRPKNIRFMKWAYIDFDAALMTIPKEAMKVDLDKIRLIGLPRVSNFIGLQVHITQMVDT